MYRKDEGWCSKSLLRNYLYIFNFFFLVIIYYQTKHPSIFTTPWSVDLGFTFKCLIDIDIHLLTGRRGCGPWGWDLEYSCRTSVHFPPLQSQLSSHQLLTRRSRPRRPRRSLPRYFILIINPNTCIYRSCYAYGHDHYHMISRPVWILKAVGES